MGAAVLLALLPALPTAAASGERITSYDAALTVRPDGSLQVRETIGYDFGGSQRHGIERKIDTEQRYDDNHDRNYPVSDIAASSPDAPAQVHLTRTDASTTVRIGDPDRTITGRHTYVISYTVAAATTAFGDHDELYWNAYGPDWDVPVDTITVALGALLPYAVALGLAPQLASAFSSSAGVVAGGYAYASNPMWWSTFAGDATRATSPASSSSGGGSGFSGGSAGGGGGGGGGGSW
jgi:uncharacterized membrane protein